MALLPPAAASQPKELQSLRLRLEKAAAKAKPAPTQTSTTTTTTSAASATATAASQKATAKAPAPELKQDVKTAAPAGSSDAALPSGASGQSLQPPQQQPQSSQQVFRALDRKEQVRKVRAPLLCHWHPPPRTTGISSLAA